MSSLNDRLQRIKDNFVKQAPADALAVMERATDDLRASDLLSGSPAVGSPLPAFDLPDTEGTSVRSRELIQRGPLVVTFYRGVW